MRKTFILLFLLVSSMICAQSSVHKRLFILLGQSNMSGRAPIESADTAALPLVKLLNADGCFEVARNPLNRFSNIRKDIGMQKLGPGYSFARILSEQLQDTIFLVVNARGGTALERFMKNDSTGYYEQTLNRIKQALRERPSMRPEAVIWHQGESNREDYRDYLKHLNKFVTDLRNDLNVPALPFIAGELGRWNSDYSHIVKRIALIPDSISNAWLVSSEGLTNVDKFHFDTKSQRELGKRYAEAFLKLPILLHDKILDCTTYKVPTLEEALLAAKGRMILAFDGYPYLYSTLYKSNFYWVDILENSPLCMRLYKSTRGVKKENYPFDGCTYLKIKPKK